MHNSGCRNFEVGIFNFFPPQKQQDATDLKIKPAVVILRHGHLMNIQIPLHSMWYPGAWAEGFFISLHLHPEKLT